MLRDLMHVLFTREWRLVEVSAKGLSSETAAAFEAFWRDSSRSSLVSAATALHTSFDGFATNLNLLAQAPSANELLGEWVRVATDAEHMAKQDPVAGALSVLYSLAAYQRELTFSMRALSATSPHAAWYELAPIAARTLLAADAITGARMVAELAYEFIAASKLTEYETGNQAALDALAGILHRIDARQAECVVELAWDLRGACDPDRPNLRAHLAALLWAQGDTRRAHLLGAPGQPAWIPDLAVLNEVLSTAYGQLQSDPFQLHVWRMVSSRKEMDLQNHRVFFASLRAAQHAFSQADLEFEVDMQRFCAQCAVNFFSPEGVSPQDREQLEDYSEYYPWAARSMPPTHSRLSIFRFEALANLILERDSKTQSGVWRRLARDANRDLLTRAVSAPADREFVLLCRMPRARSFDRRFEIPFGYLKAESLADLGNAMDVLESARAAHLGYVFQSTPPGAWHEPAAAEAELLQQEAVLLQALRDARFAVLLPALPLHYRRLNTTIQDPLNPPKNDAYSPILNLDDRKFAEHFDKCWDLLGELHEKMAAVMPAFAAARREPQASLKAFVSAVRDRASP